VRLSWPTALLRRGSCRCGWSCAYSRWRARFMTCRAGGEVEEVGRRLQAGDLQWRPGPALTLTAEGTKLSWAGTGGWRPKERGETRQATWAKGPRGKASSDSAHPQSTPPAAQRTFVEADPERKTHVTRGKTKRRVSPSRVDRGIANVPPWKLTVGTSSRERLWVISSVCQPRTSANSTTGPPALFCCFST